MSGLAADAPVVSGDITGLFDEVTRVANFVPVPGFQRIVLNEPQHPTSNQIQGFFDLERVADAPAMVFFRTRHSAGHPTVRLSLNNDPPSMVIGLPDIGEHCWQAVLRAGLLQSGSNSFVVHVPNGDLVEFSDAVVLYKSTHTTARQPRVFEP